MTGATVNTAGYFKMRAVHVGDETALANIIRLVDALVDRGNTVWLIEHNLDVIRSADWVIDLGPDAGDRGGEVVFAGTPEDLAAQGKTFTAQYLR